MAGAWGSGAGILSAGRPRTDLPLGNIYGDGLLDLCFLPLRSSVFDKAASINVFQHVPTWKSRVLGLREIRRVLKRNSLFLITAYNHSILGKFHNRHKQAYRRAHAGLLYFYSFDLSEFKYVLLSTFSKLVDLRGILILIFFQQFLDRIGLRINRTRLIS